MINVSLHLKKGSTLFFPQHGYLVRIALHTFPALFGVTLRYDPKKGMLSNVLNVLRILEMVWLYSFLRWSLSIIAWAIPSRKKAFSIRSNWCTFFKPKIKFHQPGIVFGVLSR
eukprot:scpid97162/ scgid31820/ 